MSLGDFSHVLVIDLGASALSIITISYAIAAIGLNLHFGYTGLLNFGQAGFMAMAGYALASSVATWGLSFWLGLVIGLVIAFAGVATIAVATSTGRHDLAGVLFALGAAVLYAAGVLLQKPALKTVDAFTATWLGCLAGTAACLPFAPQLLHDLAAAPADATLGVVYLGVFPTAIAFGTWAYALKRMSAGRLSSSSYLVPAIAVLLSWLLLGEVPTLLALVGGALCLIGVAVTRLPQGRKATDGSSRLTQTARHEGARRSISSWRLVRQGPETPSSAHQVGHES